MIMAQHSVSVKNDEFYFFDVSFAMFGISFKTEILIKKTEKSSSSSFARQT